MPEQIHSVHAVFNVPGGGHAFAELLAAGESAFVEPGVGVDGDGAALQLLRVDRRHDRLQQRQKTLYPHLSVSLLSFPLFLEERERERESALYKWLGFMTKLS